MSDKWTSTEEDTWMVKVTEKKKFAIEIKDCKCRTVKYLSMERSIITETDYCAKHGAVFS